MQTWPYPFWIAHRGAGKDAPENTLEAIRLGAQRGYAMFECDVKLSEDEQLFLMHDDDVRRTTNGHGLAMLYLMRDLQILDAGAWHSAQYARARVPTLKEVAALCRELQLCVNLEIKPNPQQDAQTGAAVAQQAAVLWQECMPHSPPPLLSSFSISALRAAQQAAPEIPRALLLEHWTDDALQQAQNLGCVAVVLDHILWDEARHASAHALGLKCLSYTVNDEATLTRLLNLNGTGLDGIITDRMDFAQQPLKTAV